MTKEPIILCVDTSTQTITVAICSGEKSLVERSEPAQQHHSKILLRVIDECLRKANLELQNIDAFATTMGPGSFTGIRTSLGTIKALSFSTQKPFIGISTLLAMVHPLQKSTLATAVLEARKDFVYVCNFEKKNHLWNPIDHPQMISTSCLKDFILNGSTIVGIDSKSELIRGKTLCEIALQKFNDGDFEDALTVEPVYIQKTAAEGYV